MKVPGLTCFFIWQGPSLICKNFLRIFFLGSDSLIALTITLSPSCKAIKRYTSLNFEALFFPFLEILLLDMSYFEENSTNFPMLV